MEVGGSQSGLGRGVRRELAAFLRFAREREEPEERLAEGGRSRPDRYRDLLVIVAVIRLQYAQLAGRLTIDDGQSPLPDLPSVDGADTVPEWARPWGFHAMHVLRASHNVYGQRRDRLGRWLSANARAGAAAEARSYLAGLADRLEISQELIVALSRSLVEGASGANSAERPKVVGSPGLIRATAVGATACVAAGLGALSLGAPSGRVHDSAIAPQAVANAPERPLPELVESSREPRPAGHRDTRQHPKKAATPVENGGSPREPRSGTGSAPGAPPTSESMPTTAPAPTTTTAPQPTSAPDPTSSPEPIQPLPSPKPEPAPAPPPEPSPASP
jgi:hypothetical protein